MDWPQVCLSENSELNFDDLEFDLEYSVMLILAMNLYFSITLLFPEYPGNSVWHLLQSPHPLLNPKHPPMILHSNWTLQPWNILFFWEPMNQTWTTQSTALSFSSTVLHCCFCGSSDNLCTVANNKGKKSSQPDFQCLYNMQSRRFDKSLKESKLTKEPNLFRVLKCQACTKWCWNFNLVNHYREFKYYSSADKLYVFYHGTSDITQTQKWKH